MALAASQRIIVLFVSRVPLQTAQVASTVYEEFQISRALSSRGTSENTFSDRDSFLGRWLPDSPESKEAVEK